MQVEVGLHQVLLRHGHFSLKLQIRLDKVVHLLAMSCDEILLRNEVSANLSTLRLSYLYQESYFLLLIHILTIKESYKLLGKIVKCLQLLNDFDLGLFSKVRLLALLHFKSLLHATLAVIFIIIFLSLLIT